MRKQERTKSNEGVKMSECLVGEVRMIGPSHVRQ